MFCTKCGKRIPDDSVFCPFCGANVSDAEQSAPDETRVMDSNLTQPAPSPPQQPYWNGQDPDATAQRQAMPQQSPDKAPRKPSQHRSLVIGIVIGVLCGVAVLLAIMFAMKLGPFAVTETQDEATEAATTTADAETEDAEGSDATTEPATSESSDETDSSDSEDYILPDSSTRLYTADELADYTDWELYIARNEIYARHGRRFKNDDLQEYFDSKPWYSGTIDPEDFSDDMLSDIERQNALTIRSVEESRDSEYLD